MATSSHAVSLAVLRVLAEACVPHVADVRCMDACVSPTGVSLLGGLLHLAPTAWGTASPLVAHTCRVLRAVCCGASPAVQASVRGAVVATLVGDSVVAAGTPLAQHLRSLLGTPGASSALLTLVTVVVACGPR